MEIKTERVERQMTEQAPNEYVSDGANRYLRIVTTGDVLGGYELKMLKENRPEGLLRIHPQWEGETPVLDYQISGMTLLSSIAPGSAEEYLYAVLSGLDTLSGVLSDHYLHPESLSLRPDRVYLRSGTGQVCFCYVPGTKTPLSESLSGLMEFFLKNGRPEKERDVLLLYGLYQKSREENVTLETLFQYWRSETTSSRASLHDQTVQRNETVVTKADDDPWAAGRDDDFMFFDDGAWEQTGTETVLPMSETDKKGPVRRLAGTKDPERSSGVSDAKDRKGSSGPLTNKVKARMEPLLAKLPEKVRERFFEIVIALIVVVGAVLFFVI